jgi:hypothetical protein
MDPSIEQSSRDTASLKREPPKIEKELPMRVKDRSASDEPIFETSITEIAEEKRVSP